MSTIADRLRNHARDLRAAADSLETTEQLTNEVVALRDALATESSRKCASEHDCVWQPHCAHAEKCMRPEMPQLYSKDKP
jgi:hypothetical protein